MSEKYEVATLSAFVHGALASLHLLGLVYNYKRRNKMDIVMHGLALAYDFKSLVGHYKDAKTQKKTIDDLFI